VAVTPQQEIQSIARRNKSKRYSQDKANPMCINVNDGRLFPNVPNIRNNPDYRVYTGDINASQKERLDYLKSGIGPKRARVVIDAEPAPFVVATADKDDLIAFASVEYGYALDARKTVEQLRVDFTKYLKALEAADAVAQAETADSLG
jgi:hypothetical protein